MVDRIEQLCVAKGMRMTGQRRVIARVLSISQDHPDVEEVHRRATALDPRISIATVYRTVRLLEEAGILERHDFRDGRARYEEAPEAHHDHLIDLASGRVIEFRNEAIEELQRRVAAELGFRLIDHRLELYGVPLEEQGRRDAEARAAAKSAKAGRTPAVARKPARAGRPAAPRSPRPSR
jgi:Fur family ferric uptake transcriptional regulator